MELSGDELAGVVDLFGGLTRAELDRAFEELAFKHGVGHDSEALEDAVDAALESYHLVTLEQDGTELLTAGPVAFPTLPDDASDLPHILGVEERTIDRKQAGEAARDRLESDALEVAKAGDSERAEVLLDVCYDLEAWGPVDTDRFRDRLDDV